MVGDQIHRGVRLLLPICLILGFSNLAAPTAQAAPNWTKIYETVTPNTSSASGTATMAYVSGFGKTGGAASSFIAAGTSWDLIKIRMEMTLVSNSTKYYAEVYFDKWAGATISDLQFPDSANNLLLKQNLTNLVVASDYSGVKTGSYSQGRLEFWSHCYGTGNSGYAPYGNDGLYDWDDSVNGGSGCYGSYQVHNLTDTQTIMAWNDQVEGRTADLGLGSNPTGHPDWTFGDQSVWNQTNFKVQVFVGNAITASSINAPTISGAQLKSKSTTLTATTSVAGKVTFYFGTKKIPGCSSKSTVDVLGTPTATCTFKPFTSGPMKYSARLVPTSSSYTSSTSPVTTAQIGRRSGVR
jgi:hypothetical protein